MKYIILIILILSITPALAQFDSRGGGEVTGEDEGSSLGLFNILDAVGAGVTATFSGNRLTLTVPGAGSATFTVQENDVNISTVITILDFFGADFDITESPSGEANIVIAAAIARDSELHSAITMSGAPDYITLNVQDIVRGLIDLANDVIGTLPDGNIPDHTGEVTGGTGLIIDRTTSFDWTGTHTFVDDLFRWQNPANTFQYIVSTSAIIADREITLPLLTGADTFTFNSFIATLSNKTLITPTISSTGFTNAQHAHAAANSGGLLTTLGTIAIGVWNGTAVTYANLNFSNNIVAGDLADNSVDSGELVDGSIDESHLNITNAGTDNFVLTFNSAGGNYTWAADATGSGAWTDADPVLLATSTRNVEIGDTGVTLDAKVQIAGDADEVQLIVEAHTTQTDDVFIIQQDDETQVFTVSNAGNVGLAGTLDGVDIAARDAIPLVKSFVIISPVTGDDYPLMEAPYNFTITAIHILVEGGTNVVGGLFEADSNGDSPVAIDADLTGVAGTASDDDGSLTNPTVDDGDYLLWITNTVSGTPTSLTVTFEYTVD